MLTLFAVADVAVFLSTPSARRATVFRKRQLAGPNHFYPRPPRGGRPKCVEINGVFKCISIHALREEGDSSRSS